MAVHEVVGLEGLEVILMGEEADVGMASIELHDVNLGQVDSCRKLVIGLQLGFQNLRRPLKLSAQLASSSQS